MYIKQVLIWNVFLAFISVKVKRLLRAYIVLSTRLLGIFRLYWDIAQANAGVQYLTTQLLYINSSIYDHLLHRRMMHNTSIVHPAPPPSRPLVTPPLLSPPPCTPKLVNTGCWSPPPPSSLVNGGGRGGVSVSRWAGPLIPPTPTPLMNGAHGRPL